MKWTAAVWLVVAMAGQQQGALPLRLGALAGQLTDAQVAALSQLVMRPDQLWLLVATEAFSPPPRSWTVDVYLTADTMRGQVRRGRIITAVSTGADPDRARLVWEIRGVDRWAQVASQGNVPGNHIGDRDLERPFRVVGDFADDEIVSLIEFLRTSPRTSTTPGAADQASPDLSTTVQGSWPVSRLRRTAADAIEVHLLKSEHDGQLVVMKRAVRGWTITDLRFWVSG